MNNENNVPLEQRLYAFCEQKLREEHGLSVEALTSDHPALSRVPGVFAEAFVLGEHMVVELTKHDPDGVVTAMTETAKAMVDEVTRNHGSMVVMDATGQIAGLVLADQYSGEETILSPELAPVSAVLNRLNRLGVDYVAAQPPTHKVLNILIAATDKAYQGRRIMIYIVPALICMAKAQGFSHVIVMATSNSQIVLPRLGFESIGSVPYSDIPELQALAEQSSHSKHHITAAHLMWLDIDKFLERQCRELQLA